MSDADVAAPAGVKHDGEKARWDLLPWGAVAGVVRVLGYGAKKYAPDNWRHVPGWRERYFAAAQRHMVAWFEGERVDPETGESHLSHACCSIMFMLALDRAEEVRRDG